MPATDAPPTLGRCLAALRAAAPQDAEIIVVSEPPGAGPAAARNAGAARARGEILAFVDADVVVHPDALARLEAAFAGDPQPVAVFGAYDAQPEAPGLVSRFRNLLHHHVHASEPGEARTFWAGLGAVRRDAFEAVGGFDARRFPRPAVEDIDLGMRLRAAGGRILLDPAIQGTHLKAWTLRSMLSTDFARRGLPWARLMLERGERDPGLNLTPRRRLAAASALTAAAAAAVRRPRLALGLAAASVAASAPFYSLLFRAGGPQLAAAGVPLHFAHHLAAGAAVGAALVAHLAARLGVSGRSAWSGEGRSR